MKLSEQLKNLKELRDKKNRFREELAKKQKLFLEENKELFAVINIVSADSMAAEDELRTEALKEFNLTGNKNLAGGVKIKIMSKLVYEPDKALAWAMEHSLALALDKKAFDNIAKTNKIDFVEYTDVPTATIPTNIEVD